MKKLIGIITLAALSYFAWAQSPIDRPAYINTYRTRGAYLTKPLPERAAKVLSEPVCVNGYLWVYPIDLGYFTFHPYDVISQINAQEKYGRSNWRIPTPSELMMMEDNAATIGLGDDIYMAKSHSNGILRLVSVDGEIPNCIRVGKTYWLKANLGGKSEYSYEDAIRLCPAGYRLPKKAEYEELLAWGNAYFEQVSGNRNAELYFPAIYHEGWTWVNATRRETYEYYGNYFILGNRSFFTFSSYQINWWGNTEISKPQIISEKLDKGMVRYVLDK